MIRAPFDRPELLRKLRPAFEAGPIRSVLLPLACEPGALPARYARFDVAHRGKYEVAELRDRAARGPPVVYRRLEKELIVPQLPGLIALVERTKDLYRYDRYLPAFVGRAEVVRLRASFRYAE